MGIGTDPLSAALAALDKRRGWIIVALVVLVALAVVVLVVWPKAVAWLVGGAVAGGVTLAQARRRNRDAAAEHRAVTALNSERIESANARGAQAVAEASQDPGPTTEPPEDPEDAERRRAALRGASDRLR